MGGSSVLQQPLSEGVACRRRWRLPGLGLRLDGPVSPALPHSPGRCEKRLRLNLGVSRGIEGWRAHLRGPESALTCLPRLVPFSLSQLWQTAATWKVFCVACVADCRRPGLPVLAISRSVEYRITISSKGGGGEKKEKGRAWAGRTRVELLRWPCASTPPSSLAGRQVPSSGPVTS